MYSLEDGKFAVKTARKIIETVVSGEEPTVPEPPDIFKIKSGIFV
jgi:AMMECR1 domain-containing protein